MACCWLLALLVAITVFVAFVGNIVAGFVADLSLFAIGWILAIVLATILIIRGMQWLESWAWAAAVIYLVLHLLGLLAPLAALGLWNIFHLEVQSDFGLARSPKDDDSYLSKLSP